MASRVVITGLGVISPIGIGVSEFWKRPSPVARVSARSLP